MADQKVRIQTPLGKLTDPNANGYLNCIHANIVSLWSYFAEQVFNNDLSRIVYASNDFAFMRRVELNAEAKTQGLNLPFQNFRVTNIQKGGDRLWFNRQMAILGLEDYVIGKRIKMIPFTINFESTIYTHTEADLMWIQQNLLWNSSMESKIRPQVTLTSGTGSTDIDLIGILGFEPAYNPEFSEKDWLEKNKIRTISLDNLSVQSFLIHDSIRNVTYSLTKEFILKLYAMSPTETFAKMLIERTYTSADFT